MTSLDRELRAARAAFTFLTRLPLGRLASHDPRDLEHSATYFPLVGLIVGALGGLAYVLAAKFWSPFVAVALSTCVTVRATGAFHEDALADAFDGFGGGWSRDQVLAIMKDSRVGSYALVGTVLVLAVKLGTLTTLAQTGGARAVLGGLIGAHVLGRWSGAPLLWRYPYARPSSDEARPSAGKPFAGGLSGVRCAWASLLTVTIVYAAAGTRVVSLSVAAILITWLCGRYAARRIGGVTGDVLGAVNQLVEVSVYLTLAARVA